MVTHIAHFAVSKNGVRWLFHGLATGVGNQPAARQAVDFGVHHIRSVQNRDHTGRGQGGGFIDALDVGVGVGRAHKHSVRHVGQIDVVGVVTGTGQEAVVFFTAKRFADVR